MGGRIRGEKADKERKTGEGKRLRTVREERQEPTSVQGNKVRVTSNRRREMVVEGAVFTSCSKTDDRVVSDLGPGLNSNRQLSWVQNGRA